MRVPMSDFLWYHLFLNITQGMAPESVASLHLEFTAVNDQDLPTRYEIDMSLLVGVSPILHVTGNLGGTRECMFDRARRRQTGHRERP